MRRGQIPLEELASLPVFAAATPSHSGEKIGFFWDKTGRFELYVMDIRTRKVEQITDGQAPRSLRAGFEWTRDDQAIVFARDNDGDEQNNLFLAELATRAVTQLNDDPKTQEYAGPLTRDNKRIVVMSNRNGQMNLFLFHLAERTWEQVTHFKAPASPVDFSPNGEWLALNSNESANLNNQDGYIMRVNGAELKKVFSVREGSKDTISDWHPDGRRLAVTSDASGSYRAGVLTLESGEVRWFGQEGAEEHAGHFSPDGQWLVVIRNQDSAVMPVLYHVETGEQRELKLPPGMAGGAHFVLGGAKLVVQATASNRRSELLLYDLASDTYEVLLPAVYGSIDPSVFVKDEYVKYPSSDGQLVPAILYKPRDIQPGERLPAIVVVHGGPTAQFFRGFDGYAQFLVDQGYVVLQPNVRGSTGYGVTWRDLNRKDWGGGDLDDVAAGSDYLRTLDFVDPDRIGVFGGSYGGFMSFMAAVKKPDHFKVSVPFVGISDLLQLYEESMEHFKYYLGMQMGDPKADRELWLDRSAVNFAHQMKGKMLIMHGTNDPRCPISQARIFRDKLLAVGKKEGTAPDADFEYHELEGEGHGSGDIQQKLRSYRMLADFLQRRL